MILYKYRSIENFKYFVDIILKQRLYAAPYFDLNDPMEGHYIYTSGYSNASDVARAIKGEKESLRIVSLSRNKDDILMWAHYADGHRGVVIGVEVNPYILRKVTYSNDMFNIPNLGMISNLDIAKVILTQKHLAWSYEQEERIFVQGGQHFAEVKVKEVILGSKMSTQNQGLIRELINKIDPGIHVKKSLMRGYEFSA